VPALVALLLAAVLPGLNPGAALADSQADNELRTSQLLQQLTDAGRQGAVVAWSRLSSEDQAVVRDALTPASYESGACSGCPIDIGDPADLCGGIECPEVYDDEVATGDASASAGTTETGAPPASSIQRRQSAQALGAGCWNMRTWIQAKSKTGRKLWKYGSIIDWCSDGASFTSISANPFVVIESQLWFFRGHEINNLTGGVDSTVAHHFAQGNLEACFVKGFGCYSARTPWVESRVTASGVYTSDASY
jgi:hypothetical protein